MVSAVTARRTTSLSYAGSLPFVLDDALRGVRGEGLDHLLGRLERMSSAVQVVILSDDDEIAAWAEPSAPTAPSRCTPCPCRRQIATRRAVYHLHSVRPRTG